MNQSAAVWLLILLAALLANLPFVNERLFGLISLGARSVKSFLIRLGELLVFYVLIGLIGWALEAAIGNVFRQKWQFYVITLTLFLVLGFPGFVYRYLLRRSPLKPVEHGIEP